mgnify:CR=1 FL=1
MEILVTPRIVNSIGLIFDIFGAWLVAWEVVHKFKGEQHDIQPLIANGNIPRPAKSNEFVKYEANKYGRMWCGIICLTIGFILQISSNWIQLPQKEVNKIGRASCRERV